MYSWQKIVRASILLLTLCIFVEIFAGQLLQNKQNLLVAFPLLLISIPVINSVGGNIGTILGSRLASGLHVGYVQYSIRDKHMHSNLVSALLLGIITYSVLAMLIYLIASLGGIRMNISVVSFILIVLGTGVLLIGLLSLISIVTAFMSFKRGLDPDDMVAPVVTTAGDTLGIVFLFVLVGVIGI